MLTLLLQIALLGLPQPKTEAHPPNRRPMEAELPWSIGEFQNPPKPHLTVDNDQPNATQTPPQASNVASTTRKPKRSAAQNANAKMHSWIHGTECKQPPRDEKRQKQKQDAVPPQETDSAGEPAGEKQPPPGTYDPSAPTYLEDDGTGSVGAVPPSVLEMILLVHRTTIAQILRMRLTSLRQKAFVDGNKSLSLKLHR